jgi:acetylornithine/LysW-gamma-L-lysine aminotransferase
MNLPKTNAEIVELETRYTSGVYNLRSVAMVRGQGAHLWDADGREYIDCIGGHGVVNVGHCNPDVVQAICAQAATLITCPTSFPNDKRSALVAELIRIAPFKAQRVFLCNSGTESVEAAFKFARLVTGRKSFIAAKNAFHGRTFGALSATWNAEYRKPFEPLVPGFTHVAYNDAAALEQAMTEDTAAVILEIVQGEGGVRPGDGEYLRRAQALCRERGAMLIIDEVQTGFGRTGKMFACEHYGIEPDLLCVAKSIAGGIPMGAVLIGERLGELASQSHGTTFGGSPIACAAALAAIHFIEANKLPERAAELGAYFMEQLRQIKSPLIREVRGLGLMIGAELKQRSAPYIAQLIERGVLTLPAGPIVLRFLPPLVIGKEDIDNVIKAVTDVLAVQK